MAVRGGRGAGLRRAALGRPGLVALVVALYLGAGVVATWPALQHAGSHFLARATTVPGEAAAGDHLQAEYHLWLVGHQLEHGRAPWRDPYTFRPESPTRTNFGGWPFGLPFWPLSAALGDVLGWNLLLLLTYLAAGAFAYLWLRELGLPRGAALVGGLVFALAPYRVAQSAGHLRGPISALLPLALWAFERARHESRWWLVAAGAALASIPFSDVHLALGAVPFFALYAVCRSRDPVVLGGAALVTAAAVGTSYLVGNRTVSGSIGSGGRTLREVSHYSADGLDLVTRHPRHGLESFVFLGWLTPVLALVGLGLLLGARRYGLALALGLGALVPVLLAFGTNLPLYSFVWHHLPPLRYPRVPERQMPIACLRWRRSRRSPSRACAGRCVAALPRARRADLRVWIYEAPRPTPATRLRGLRRAAGPAARAAGAPPERAPRERLPLVRPGRQRERPGGYSTIAPEPRAGSRCGWPAQLRRLAARRRRALRRLGVRYVAFHRGLTGETGWFAWRALRATASAARPRRRDHDRSSAAVAAARRPSPSPAAVSLLRGLDGGSPRYRHAALWAKGPVGGYGAEDAEARAGDRHGRRPPGSMHGG
jgi:hypothetical protein